MVENILQLYILIKIINYLDWVVFDNLIKITGDRKVKNNSSYNVFQETIDYVFEEYFLVSSFKYSKPIHMLKNKYGTKFSNIWFSIINLIKNKAFYSQSIKV